MFRPIIAQTACAAVVLSLGLSVAANAPAEDVVVVGWSGASQDALRKTFFEPYVAETGNNIVEDSWNEAIPYGAASKAAYELVSADTIAQLPTAPANLAVQLEVGTDFWVENVGALSERFNSWVDE